MIVELLSSIILATNVSGCVASAATYAQDSSSVYTPQIRESRTNQNVDDTEYDAVRLSPENFNELDSYQFSISSELYGRLGNTDYDYYYISVLSKSVFTFSVTNESILPYSFSIYTYVNSHQDGEYVYSSSNVILNVDVEEEYQNSIVLNPGTYYVLFDGLGTDLGGELIAYYDFNGTVRRNYSSYTVDVNEARFAKGLKGIYWESDYLPIDFEEESINQSITYYQRSKNSCNSPKYNLDDLRTISNGNKIRYKTYYIFDKDMIDSMIGYFTEFINKIEEIVNETEQQIDKINLAYNVTNGVLQLVSFVLALFGNQIISFSYAIAYPIVLDLIFDFVYRQINFDYSYKNLSSIKSLLSRMQKSFLDIINYCTIGDNSSHPVQWKGLEISLFYSLKKENVNVGYPKHYVFVDHTHIEINSFSVYYNSTLSNIFSDTYGTTGNLLFISDDVVDNYDDIPEVYAKESLELVVSNRDYGMSVNCYGETVEYSFVAPKSSDFYFYFSTLSNMDDPQIDIFFVRPKGYDNTNRIGSYKGKYIDEANHNNHGTWFKKYLNQGEKLYTRMIVQEARNCDKSVIINARVSYEDLGNYYHEHNYNSYSYVNGSQHRASCSCGDSYLEYHAVRSGSRICMYCRGIVDKGIIDIPFSLLDRSIEGYYVHESGVKIYE